MKTDDRLNPSLDSSQKIEEQVEVKASWCTLRVFLCFLMTVALATSIAFNIYLGIYYFQARGLNIEKTSHFVGQSCEITTFNMSLQSQLAGAYLRVIPECAKHTNNTDNQTNARLLVKCAVQTTQGVCLYCTKKDLTGVCIQYSNVDPNKGYNLQTAAQAWIKCVIDNIEVISYGLQSCTVAGLKDFVNNVIVENIKKAFCFPAMTRVITESGIIDIGSLKIGDSILSLVGSQPQFSKITAWFHYDKQSYSNQYLRITDETNGSFIASAHHNIAVQNQTYFFAKNLLEERLHGSEKDIKKIEIVEEKGIFAPMTASGNYFILNSNDEKVLAHCFAHIKDPELYEGIVHAAVSVYDTFFEPSYAEIHPLGKWFESVLDLLFEK